jgi:peptidoglycan/LPS O-acetylase OafA/YrhL
MSQRPQLEGANAVRFWAAMSIVLFHLALLPKKELPAFLSVIPNFAGFGVPLFYVLSAFALSYGYYASLESGAAIRRFYARRFFRIAPLFYLMMAVCLTQLWIRGIGVPASQIFSSATFIFNLIPGHSESFVPAAWSIGVEMLFYAVFPFIMMLITNVARYLFFGGAVWFAAPGIWIPRASRHHRLPRSRSLLIFTTSRLNSGYFLWCLYGGSAVAPNGHYRIADRITHS